MPTMSSANRFDLHQTVTDRIIALLEGGVIPWRKPWSADGPPMNAITKHRYSGVNLWLLLGLDYESNLFLTFEQVSMMGGTVNRGEKGHLVVFWKLLEKEQKEGKELPSTDKIPLLRYYKVFNTEQCNNLPPVALDSLYEQPNYPVAMCEGIVQNMPNCPEIRFGKAKAFYHPKEDYINMPPMRRFTGSEAYYTTLFHELVHSTGHASRLDRKTLTERTEFGSPDYCFEELVAELGSCYLCAHAGLEQKKLENSVAYIQAWLTQLQNDRRLVISASSQAQRAVDYILHGQTELTVIGQAQKGLA